MSTLCNTLASKPYNLPTVVLSIDDLYLTHDQQQTLARRHPHNPLVQHRGQPSTHDVQLGTKLFESLRRRDNQIKIPSYDKSAYHGQGDRREQSEWTVVNEDPSKRPVEVVIFEGWCVGFRPRSDDQLEQKWREAKSQADNGQKEYSGRLGKLKLEDVKFVNEALKQYNDLTESVLISCLMPSSTTTRS